MDSTAASRLAHNLRRLREQRGWSQQYLADVSGIPRATVANLESGDGNPTLNIIVRLTGTLDATFEQLLACTNPRATLIPAEQIPRRRCDKAWLSEYVATSAAYRVERIEIERQGYCELRAVQETERCVIICEVGSVIAVNDSTATRVRSHDALEIHGRRGLRLENPKSRKAVVYRVLLPPAVSR